MCGFACARPASGTRPEPVAVRVNLGDEDVGGVPRRIQGRSAECRRAGVLAGDVGVVVGADSQGIGAIHTRAAHCARPEPRRSRAVQFGDEEIGLARRTQFRCAERVRACELAGYVNILRHINGHGFDARPAIGAGRNVRGPEPVAAPGELSDERVGAGTAAGQQSAFEGGRTREKAGNVGVAFRIQDVFRRRGLATGQFS